MAAVASTPMNWLPPAFETLCPPQVAIAVLKSALARAPGDRRLLTRLGQASLDRFDYQSAAEAFASVLEIEPGDVEVRAWLARCLNELGRGDECIGISDPDVHGSNGPLLSQRGRAFLAAGRTAEAEAAYEAALGLDPLNAEAARRLLNLVFKSGRSDDLLALCERLHDAGARHPALWLAWGRGLLLASQPASARRLLPDRPRIARIRLPPPAPFPTFDAFASAFADSLIAHPDMLTEFPDDDANRGSREAHAVGAGSKPELVRALTAVLQASIDEFVAGLPSAECADGWLRSRPRSAQLQGWGLIQGAGEYEDWHFHPRGWLSGVCYLRVPDRFSIDGEGEGCIEYGVDPSLPGAPSPIRIAPEEGLLLLAPSHYQHRTIPFSCAGWRVSFAFDVVPVADA